MDPHRPLGDTQVAGNGLIGQPAGDARQDLALAGGQVLQGPKPVITVVDHRGREGEVLDESAGGGGSHDRVAGVHMVDCSHELLQGRVFEEEAAGARPDGLIGVLIKVEGGQDDHPRAIGSALDDGARRVNPVHPRHAHVHEDNVRLDPLDQIDGGASVLRLPNDFDTLLGLQQHAETESVHLLVIDEDESKSHAFSSVPSGAGSGDARDSGDSASDRSSHGSTARRRKPPPSRGPASRAPPWEATRSCMPRRP